MGRGLRRWRSRLPKARRRGESELKKGSHFVAFEQPAHGLYSQDDFGPEPAKRSFSRIGTSREYSCCRCACFWRNSQRGLHPNSFPAPNLAGPLIGPDKRPRDLQSERILCGRKDDAIPTHRPSEIAIWRQPISRAITFSFSGLLTWLVRRCGAASGAGEVRLGYLLH